MSAAHAYGPRKHTTPCKQTLVNVLLVNLKLDYFPQQMYINMRRSTCTLYRATSKFSLLKDTGKKSYTENKITFLVSVKEAF